MNQYPTIEGRGEIPDAERADMALSPVRKEEMEAALKQMQEAVKEGHGVNESVESNESKLEAILVDQKETEARIKELLAQLKAEVSNVPKEQMKEVPPEPPVEDGSGDGGNEKMEPIIMREANIKYETCRNCKGKGRVLFRILTCPKCGGSGKAPALKQNWSNKIVGYRKPGKEQNN